MEFAGIVLVAGGLFGMLFGGPPSEPEKEVLSKFDEIKNSSSARLIVIDDKKLNLGFIILGIIFLLV